MLPHPPRLLGHNGDLLDSVRPRHRSKCQRLRCLKSRGPTPTRRWCGPPRGRGHTFNYDIINSRDPAAQVSSVWRIPAVPRREKRHGGHPTQKPLRLVRRAILACTREGDLVFDPFSGSGTTAVAAKELGRSFVGAELEREFCGLAARRLRAAERGVLLGEIRAMGPGG